MLSPEANQLICVDVAGLEREDYQVQCALAGMAFVAAGLLSIGQDAVVAKSATSVSRLVDQVSLSMDIPYIRDRMTAEYPDMPNLVSQTIEMTKEPEFLRFRQSLGVHDASYRLEQDKSQPNRFVLSLLEKVSAGAGSQRITLW